MSRPNHYEVLEVERDATPGQIKQAFRRLATKYHPDRNPGDRAAEERFRDCTVAYEVLSDLDARQKYDLTLLVGSSTPELALGDVEQNLEVLLGVIRRAKTPEGAEQLRREVIHEAAKNFGPLAKSIIGSLLRAKRDR